MTSEEEVIGLRQILSNLRKGIGAIVRGYDDHEHAWVRWTSVCDEIDKADIALVALKWIPYDAR